MESCPKPHSYRRGEKDCIIICKNNFVFDLLTMLCRGCWRPYQSLVRIMTKKISHISTCEREASIQNFMNGGWTDIVRNVLPARGADRCSGMYVWTHATSFC